MRAVLRAGVSLSVFSASQIFPQTRKANWNKSQREPKAWICPFSESLASEFLLSESLFSESLTSESLSRGASQCGVFPTFGIPAFGIPVFGIPTFGIPAFGIPTFGISVESRHPLIRHPLDSPPKSEEIRRNQVDPPPRGPCETSRCLAAKDCLPIVSRQFLTQSYARPNINYSTWPPKQLIRNEKSAQRPKFSAGRPCRHPAKNIGQALQILKKTSILARTCRADVHEKTSVWKTSGWFFCCLVKGTLTQTFWSGYFPVGWGSSTWTGGGQKVNMSLEIRGNQTFWAGCPGILPGYPGGARKVWEKKSLCSISVPYIVSRQFLTHNYARPNIN